MASSNGVPSDEESRISPESPDTEELPSEEEEQELEFLKKWLGWLAFSAPTAIGGITGYQRFQNIQNSNANELLHAASLFMGFSFIFAFIFWILANIVNGRHGFLKRLKHGAISVSVPFAVAVVLVIVAGFF